MSDNQEQKLKESTSNDWHQKILDKINYGHLEEEDRLPSTKSNKITDNKKRYICITV